MDIYQQFKKSMAALIKEHNLDQAEIAVNASILSPEEAIGITRRKDFPLNKGQEVMIQAVFKDSAGQAFTDQPSVFKGSLADILNMDLAENNNRALFIAASNAVLRHLGLISNTVHCKTDGPEQCAQHICEHLLQHHAGAKIGLVGLQPAILDHLQAAFDVRAVDLNPDNIGTTRYGTVIEDGDTSLESLVEWADLLLVTGSTAANGTIGHFMDIGKPVIFFGITVAGLAYANDLYRLCYCSS